MYNTLYIFIFYYILYYIIYIMCIMYIYIYKSMIIHDTYFIPNYFESCPRLVSKLRGRFRVSQGLGANPKKSLATMGIQHHQEKGIFWIIVVIIPIIVVILMIIWWDYK